MKALLIVGAATAALTGVTVGWLARGAIADHVEIPRIIEQQAEHCAATTERAAAEAVAVEQLRQFRIGERATQQFYEQSKAAAEDAQALRDVLEMEIEAYAKHARENGSVCALDTDALDLLGVRVDNQPDKSGGR